VLKIGAVPRTRKKPKDAYHHGDLRSGIGEVASAIVNQQGSAELTVRAVAQRLGVSHAAIYHHFEDRADLLAAVAERGFDQLAAVMERATAENENALLGFREQGLSYIRFAVQHPNLFGLMFRSEAGLRSEHPNLAGAADRLLERIRRAVVACQTEGILMPGTPDEHTLFCWSGVHGLASLIVEQQLGQLTVPSDLESRAQIVVDRIFTGLGARAG